MLNLALALLAFTPDAQASYLNEFALGVNYRLEKGSAACPQTMLIRTFPSTGVTLNGTRLGEQRQTNALFAPQDKENPFGAGDAVMGAQELRTEPCSALGLRCESVTTTQISRLFWNESYSRFALSMRSKQSMRHNPFYTEQINDSVIMSCRYRRVN